MQIDFERKNLLSLYRKTDGDEKHALRILAAAVGPVAAGAYETMLHSRKAARISPTLPGFDAAAALQRWKRLGLAGRERGDEGEGWSVETA